MLLTACGTIPSGRYESLRAASEGVSSTLGETYVRIEKRQREFVVLAAPNQPLTKDSFKPVIHGQSFDIKPELEYRDNVLNVLVNYCKALEALAGKNFAADVDKSARDLAASLSSLKGDERVAANGFSTVVDLLARRLTDWMRRQALKRAMDQGQPALEALVKLFQGSNQKIIPFVHQMRDSFIRHAQLDRPSYGTWKRFGFDLEVAGTLNEFNEIENALIASSAALGKLPPAHYEIRASLDDRDQNLLSLHAVIQEVRHLESFYRGLPAK